ncbi:hypothetical protein [Acuticoccus sp. I52.16.1]|uniref:hypothetical protein n=1 Tax=Acuticoccus sp. I52.16.1 TaxID=2928472 RepID=UPI001FD5BCE2|nr:hypothetical protein [Acuticoccus sp. I52.16.1]UOM35972.1 hypothetical protein MRB58_07175 [Acuticoccus sp. I52.16.1]
MDRRRRLLIALAALAVTASAPSRADTPTVTAVNAVRTGDTWRFDVTVRHADAGWDHYADAFVVTTADGRTLGTRVLHHPHVDEQPFTRSLTGVGIPPDVTTVEVHAVDSVHGPGPPVTVLLR